MRPIATQMTSPAIEQEPSSRSGSSSNEDDEADLVFDTVTSRRPLPKKQKREQPVPFEALQQAGWGHQRLFNPPVPAQCYMPSCLSPALRSALLTWVTHPLWMHGAFCLVSPGSTCLCIAHPTGALALQADGEAFLALD